MFKLLQDSVATETLRATKALKLSFKFLVVGRTHTSEVTSSSPVERVEMDRTVEVDLNYLRLSSVYSDVKLRASDRKVIFCHKWILAARSPVLRKKLAEMTMNRVMKVVFKSNNQEEEGDTNTQTKEDEILECPELDFKTLSQLVDFIYTDALCKSSDFDSCSRLFCAADSYELPLLRNDCLRCLMAKLDRSNVFGALTMAADMNCGPLRLAALDFVHENKEEVLLSDEWQDFSAAEPVLAENVMCHLRVMKQQDSYNPIIW